MKIKVHTYDDMMNLLLERGEHQCSLLGEWKADIIRKNGRFEPGVWSGPNKFPTEGLAAMLNMLFGSSSLPSAWYIFCFKNNVTPAAGDLAADKLGSTGAYGCCQDPADFDNADDGTTTAGTGEWPLYSPADTTTGVITNVAARAEFTFSAPINVYGAGLTNTASCATPGASAILLSAKRFDDAPKNPSDGDKIAIEARITLTSGS